MTGPMTGPDPLLGPPATESFLISAVEFDVLWEHYGLAAMPLILRVPSPGRTHAERARLVAGVWAGLRRRGLADTDDAGTDTADPDLEHLLRLLERPDREVDGRLWLGRNVRVLAAATADQAVLATLDGDQVSLRPADASGLPRHALSVLPPATPGRGKQSVTLPSADFEAAAAEATDQASLTRGLRARGVAGADATRLAEMIGEVVNQGQFGSASRDRLGRRTRADRVISFFDTAAGRYVQIRRESADGQPWTTISPADHRRLLGHLTDLHTAG